MSFGFSVGDCILLLQIARTQYKNCVSAGPEYTEIAREIKSLYSVLKILKEEIENPDSNLLRQDKKSAEELLSATEGCRHILDDFQTLLAKYEGLSGDGEAVSGTRKLWHKMRFGTKIQQLGDVRGKIITYTSTISVLLDAIQLKATGRLEDKVDAGFANVGDKFDTGFANVMDGFLNMKKAIVEEVLKARSQSKGRSTISLLSLSTYNNDDKEVWQEFRRELVAKGFNSRKLDRYRDVLMAYMLKLEQNGVLEKLAPQTDEQAPWWTKHAFLETTDTLLMPTLQPIVEETKYSLETDSSANAKIPLPKTNTTSLGENLFPVGGGTRSATKIAAAGIAGAAITQLYETRKTRDMQSTGDKAAAKAGLYDVQRTEKERYAEAGYRKFPGLAHDQGVLNNGTPAERENSFGKSQQETSNQYIPSLTLPPAVQPGHKDAIRDQVTAKRRTEKGLQEKMEKHQLAPSLKEGTTELFQGTTTVAEPIESTTVENSPWSDPNKTAESPSFFKEYHPYYISKAPVQLYAFNQTSSEAIPDETNILRSTKNATKGSKIPELPAPTESESEIFQHDAVDPNIRSIQSLVIKEQNPLNTSLESLGKSIEIESTKISAPISKENRSSAVSPNLNKSSYDSSEIVAGNDKLPLDELRLNIEKTVSQRPSKSEKSSLEMRIKFSKDNEDVRIRQEIPTSIESGSKSRKKAHMSYTNKREATISPPRKSKVSFKPQARFKSPGTPTGVENSSDSRKAANPFVPRVVRLSDSEDTWSDKKPKKVEKTRRSRTPTHFREERRKQKKEREKIAATDASSSYRRREHLDNGNTSSGHETKTHNTEFSTKSLKAGVLAAAAEAFRVRNESGGWGGEKGKRIITAALAAAAVSQVVSDVGDDHGRKESRKKSDAYPAYESNSYYSEEYTDTGY